jgi:DNA-binding LacI/PurR family transcriptional regulator
MLDRNITIYDIAQEAQVSPATVSRVLTGSANVSKAKKERIKQIIEKYNFQPNALARSLINKETKTIGFILPDITNPFFSTVFLEAEKQALSMGYTMILCNSMNDNMLNVTNTESLYLKTLCEKQVDGIIFMGGRINESRTNKEYAKEVNEILQKIPVVMINGRMAGVDCVKVRTDEKEGIYNLVKYLHELGHKKVGFIGGVKGITAADDKISAFKRAIKQYGMTCKEEWIIHSPFSIEDGYAITEKMLTQRELPTAIMAVNDFVAIGALRAAEAKGLKVPDDLSITGFDGMYLTDIVRPRITTVSQNCDILGATAMNVLLDILKGKKYKKETIIKSDLLIKESCKAIS